MSIFNKKPLRRDDILGADDIKMEKVAVPEWLDGYVYVKGMTGLEREQYETGYTAQREGANIRAHLASMSICDEHGVLLFSVEDAEKLGNKSSAALMRVFEVARRLSGLLGADELKKLSEEMEENPSNDSASD